MPLGQVMTRISLMLNRRVSNGFENHCKIMEGRFYECASAAFILSWDG